MYVFDDVERPQVYFGGILNTIVSVCPLLNSRATTILSAKRNASGVLVEIMETFV